MFRTFEPSEFDISGVPYRRQLKEALAKDKGGLVSMLDEHFQRWVGCDTEDIKKAIVRLARCVVGTGGSRGARCGKNATVASKKCAG